MIFHKTTKGQKTNERGNCLAAALSSLLGLRIVDVPAFEDMEKSQWKEALISFCSSKSIHAEFTRDIPSGLSIGVGIKSSGMRHAVILQDGDFHFDPSITDEYYEQHLYCISLSPIDSIV